MQVDTRTVTSVALAVACVFAVAAAADGLGSLSTDPEDVVDPEFDQLPVGQGSMESLRDEVVSREGTGDTRPQPSDSGSESSASQESQAQREMTTQAESSAQTESSAQSAANRESQSSRSERSADGSGDQPPPEDRDWLPLLALLAALAVAAVLAYRYVGGSAGGGAEDGESPFAGVVPDSEVERAWLRLVRRVDADRPESRTPGEWAAEAVDSGLDADAVGTLTRAFESVRYGGGDETEERRRRVRRALDRLNAVGTDGGTPDDADEEGAR